MTGAESERWTVATSLAATSVWPAAGREDGTPVPAEAAVPVAEAPDAERADPDRADVEAAQAGDAGAFEALVLRYQTRIVSFASALVRDAGAAEDVAQETFVRAWKGLRNFRGDSAFKSWLYKVASNAARTHLERHGRQSRLATQSLDDEEAALHAGDVPSGSTDVERTLAVREAIDAALAQLPEEWRVAVVLRDVEGLGYKEIAAVTGVPIGTVESRIFRARRRLRPLLRPVAGR